MLELSFGIATIIGALGFAIVYLIFRSLHHFEAWATREQPPKERVGAFLVLAVVMGGVAGSMAQPLVDKGISCHQASQPVVTCVLFGDFMKQAPPTTSRQNLSPYPQSRGSSKSR